MPELTKNYGGGLEKIRYGLLIIFFFSGMSSLIYQVVWQRLLGLYYGVGHISTTIIVSVFLFGLGLGAITGGRYIDKTKNCLKIYFIVELLIGIFGIASIYILELIGSLTITSDYSLTLLYVFLFLSIPTLLMGMTFPIVFKIFHNISPNFLKELSTIYFINTLGGAFGCIFGTYVLISFLGMEIAIYIAALINIVLAIGIFLMYMTKPHKKNLIVTENKILHSSRGLDKKTVAVLVFITGFMAIGYQIVWFRILRILTIDSSYSFASTLSVYLLGLAFGSYLINQIIEKKPHLFNKSLYFLLQGFIGIFITISITGLFYLIKNTAFSDLLRISTQVNLLPLPQNINIEIMNGFPLLNGMADIFGLGLTTFLLNLYINLSGLFWPLLLLFIPAMITGASFPLITSLIKNKQKAGEIVGDTYFFNVIGNVAGGLVTGFILLSYFKTMGTIFLFFVISLAFFMTSNLNKIIRTVNLNPLKLVLAPILLISLILLMPSNHEFYSEIHLPPENVQDIIIEVEEGADSVSVFFLTPPNILTHFDNGLRHGYRPSPFTYKSVGDMIAYAPRTNNLDILIIGFGGGSPIEAALSLDDSNSVTCVELSESIIHNLRKYNETREIIDDPNLELVIDDARRFLNYDERKFDLIWMAPLRVTRAYSNNLYSKEFFDLIKRHLTKEGIFVLYNSKEHSILQNTLLKEFKYLDVYQFFTFASNMPMVKKDDNYQVFLEGFDLETRKMIEEINTPFLFNQDELNDTIRVNTDYQPWLEFYSWKIAQGEAKLILTNSYYV